MVLSACRRIVDYLREKGVNSVKWGVVRGRAKRKHVPRYKKIVIHVWAFYNNKEVAAIVIPMAATPKMVVVEAAFSAWAAWELLATADELPEALLELAVELLGIEEGVADVEREAEAEMEAEAPELAETIAVEDDVAFVVELDVLATAAPADWKIQL